MTELVPVDGTLSKYTNVVKGWQNRYFMLNPQQGVLEYHISQSEAMGTHYKPRGSLLLAGAVIAPSIEDELTFSVNATNGEVYKLRASSTKERQEWISRLRAVANHFTSQIAQDHPPLSTSSSLRKQPQRRSMVSNISSNLNKIKDQVQHLSTSSSAPSFNAKPKAHHENASATILPDTFSVRSRTDSWSSIGRSTRVSDARKPLATSEVKELQDAREALVSADNYHAGLMNTLEGLHYAASNRQTKNLETESLNSSEDSSYHQPLALDRDVLLIKSTSAAMLQSLNNCYTLLHKYRQHITSSLPTNAEISWVQPRHDLKAIEDGHSTTGSSIATFEVPSIANPKDEAEDKILAHEEDLGPVDEHKNMIMHLLSQLKLGMDLTKVTLPTFILERRSLLEMYADFIGHTDLFLSIVDGASPEERMCRVIKFYLSSFHCGRQGQIAKKPYNPIVGEVFQCSYYVEKDASAARAASPSTLTHHRVKFLAEQVSHHPPVSAFYISCPDKNVSLNSHIWTKSKFMNMTVGVNNIGEGVLSLADFQEDYVMTYPSAFARSILTVPWSELGGRCSITCEKSGLSASVTFHTKPTYGGQPHRVTAEAKNGDGFVFCRVDGKWNGELNFTYYKDSDQEKGSEASDLNERRSHEEAIDLSKLKIFRKFVRSLEQQSRMESRKLWRRVTESLRNGDVMSATQHKTDLENQQREVEKQRLESQLPVPIAYFTLTTGKDYDIYTHKDSLK